MGEVEVVRDASRGQDAKKLRRSALDFLSTTQGPLGWHVEKIV